MYYCQEGPKTGFEDRVKTVPRSLTQETWAQVQASPTQTGRIQNNCLTSVNVCCFLLRYSEGKTSFIKIYLTWHCISLRCTTFWTAVLIYCKMITTTVLAKNTVSLFIYLNFILYVNMVLRFSYMVPSHYLFRYHLSILSFWLLYKLKFSLYFLIELMSYQTEVCDYHSCKQ